MFRRKKQTPPASKVPPPLPPPPPSLVQRRSVPKPTVSECLQQAQGALAKLRTINPGDLQAFPLLNEVQRLVQQLKEATTSLPPADREAWSFQIVDLEDEFRELADVVVSQADAAPKPEPRASPSVNSNSSVAVRTSKTQALLPPSNSGRVQQAVALFSRQDGFTSGSNSHGHGIRRGQTTYQQERTQQQAYHRQQQYSHPPQQQQQYSQQQYSQQQYSQQQFPQRAHHQNQHAQVAEQPYLPQAASSAASTPARSDSSFIYLTEDERELLAQKQQVLLQKHFKYIAQQRDAENHAAAGPRGATGAAQQAEPTSMQQQQQQQQQPYQPGQVSLPAVYYERRGPPSEYSSVQATPHADTADARQSPAWSTASVQGSTSGAQGKAAGGHAGTGTLAPAHWGAGSGGAAATAAASGYGQQYQGTSSFAQAGLAVPQRSDEQKAAVDCGNEEDDLFSGLDIVASDEQQSLAQPPQLPEATLPEHAHVHAQQQHVFGLRTAAAGVRTAGPAAQGNAFQPQPQRVPAHSFRPAGHSMPHRLYDASQTGSQPDSAGQPQQGEAVDRHGGHHRAKPGPGSGGQASGSPLEPYTGAPAQHMLPQQHQHEFPHQGNYPQAPLQHATQEFQVQRQSEAQQQHPQQRQLSASAHGYDQARPGAEAGSQAINALASPPWRGALPGAASMQVSPFSQAAADTVPGTGPAASTPAVSDVGSGLAYPIRKKTLHMKLGYGIDEEANSQQRQQSALAAGVQSAAGNVVGAPGVAGLSTTRVQEQEYPGVAGAYQQQNGWALQQQQQGLLQPASRAGSGFQQQQQPPQQQFCADVGQGRPVTPINNLPEVPPYGMQYAQLQQQYQQQQQQQQYPGPSSPQPVLLTDPEQYPQMHPVVGLQLQMHQQAQQQQQYPVSAAQHAGPGLGPGCYPQVWPPEGAQRAQQHHHAQQPLAAQNAEQQAYPAQGGQLPSQLQQQSQQDSHLATQFQEPQQQQVEQQARQHQLQAQQQLGQAQGQAPSWSRPDTEKQARRDGAAQQPVQSYMASLLPTTPEEQARIQLLQKIADSASAAVGSMGPRPESQYAHAAGGAGGVLAAGNQSGGQSSAFAAGAANAGAGAAVVAVEAAAAPTSDPSAGGHAAAVPAPPVTAAGGDSARPSPYMSAFMQNAQSCEAADRVTTPAATSTPRPAASATTSYTSPIPPPATELTNPSPATAASSTPVHSGTPAAPAPAGQYTQRSSSAGHNPAAPSPALSLPLSSGGVWTRSRGLLSGGGGPGVGGSANWPAVDPAASLPPLSSLPNLVALEAFLENITGSVDACRTAAEQRAREMVATLAGALSQAHKVEAAVQQQRRAVKAALAGVLASITQLEADQAAAVEGEDFETAAALDEQLTQLSYRRTSMDEQVRLLADALQQAAALRLQVLCRQAEVWRVAGAYLARLQNGQQQMAATLASQADREAQAAAMLHRAAQEALAQRRAALDERRAELEGAGVRVAAQVAAATAPAEAERQRRARARDALQADVESLRALLAAKEAALAAAEDAVAEAVAAVRQQAAAYDQDLAQLEEARRQLEAEGVQVAGHEQALQDSERQAEARAAAVEEHQAQLRLQADALGAAAGAMRCEAEALAQRVAAEARSQEQREQLLQVDEKAREELKGLERCISDLSADLSRLAEQRGRLAAERAAVQEGLAGLQRVLPELEAAKRAAAANKDFREAARLSGELRALSAQADTAAAQLARVSGELSELAAIESGKVSELEELRAMVHDAQRHAAEAHHSYLVFSLGLSRAALEEAVGSELYEEAGALQAEVAAEEAEVLALERTWGLARPPAAAAAAAAAAARRRNSLEVAAVAATSVALTAQFSRQSVGGLSAQSSRSLSAQLPSSLPYPQPQLGAAQATALKAFLPPSVGGTAGLHPSAASSTASPMRLQQTVHAPHHSPPQQPIQHHHYHQQDVPSSTVPGSASGPQGDSGLDCGSTPLVASQQPPGSQEPASPNEYMPPPLPLEESSSLRAASVSGGSGAHAVAATAIAAAVNDPVHGRTAAECPSPAPQLSDPRDVPRPAMFDGSVYGDSLNQASIQGALEHPASPAPGPAFVAASPPQTVAGPAAHGPTASAVQAPALRAEASGRSLAAEPSSSSAVPTAPLVRAQERAAAPATAANPDPIEQLARPGPSDAREGSISGDDGRSTPAGSSGTKTPAWPGAAGAHASDGLERPSPCAPDEAGPCAAAGTSGAGSGHQKQQSDQQPDAEQQRGSEQDGDRAGLQRNYVSANGSVAALAAASGATNPVHAAGASAASQPARAGAVAEGCEQAH